MPSETNVNKLSQEDYNTIKRLYKFVYNGQHSLKNSRAYQYPEQEKKRKTDKIKNPLLSQKQELSDAHMDIIVICLFKKIDDKTKNFSQELKYTKKEANGKSRSEQYNN